jgi:metallopeptidase MepB
MAHVLPSQMPPRIFSAEEVIPVTKTILRERCTVRNTVSQTVTLSTACFENVIKPLIDVDNRTQGELGVIAMLRYASPEQAAREASEEAVRLIGRSESEFTSREDLYLIIKAVKDKAEKLDFEAAKYLDSTFKDFTRCGHGILDRDQIKYYLDKRNEIDSLRRKFTQNVRDEDGGLWFSLEELDGVSEQDLSRFIEVKEPNKEGMRFVRFRRAEVDAVMRYARNPATRKKMYVADASKLTQNIDLFKEVLVQRDGNARLLGYASHAAFRLEKRVAKSPDWVDNFLDGLEEVLIPQGKREMQALLERKRIYLIGNTDYPQEYHTSMPPWDYRYYNRLALENLHVEHEKISEYFPMRNTVSAMLELFTSYLQLRFVPLPPELMVGSKWHEDVEAWSVWDEREESKGAFVGYLYADLLWRPNKYQGSQNVNLQCVRRPCLFRKGIQRQS